MNYSLGRRKISTYNENNDFRPSRDNVVKYVQELWSELSKMNSNLDIMWGGSCFEKINKKQCNRTSKNDWGNV